MKTTDPLELEKHYPRAYNQLPNSYKNDSVVEYSDECGELIAKGDVLSGEWIAKWNGFNWVLASRYLFIR
jgi:hypothetical protein